MAFNETKGNRTIEACVMAGPGGRSRALPLRGSRHNSMAPDASGDRAAAVDRRSPV